VSTVCLWLAFDLLLVVGERSAKNYRPSFLFIILKYTIFILIGNAFPAII
jgi:hypothetical protein